MLEEIEVESANGIYLSRTVCIEGEFPSTFMESVMLRFIDNEWNVTEVTSHSYKA